VQGLPFDERVRHATGDDVDLTCDRPVGAENFDARREGGRRQGGDQLIERSARPILRRRESMAAGVFGIRSVRASGCEGAAADGALKTARSLGSFETQLAIRAEDLHRRDLDVTWPQSGETVSPQEKAAVFFSSDGGRAALSD